jgi:parvulin-like peptidyl-prolyl isomerase
VIQKRCAVPFRLFTGVVVALWSLWLAGGAAAATGTTGASSGQGAGVAAYVGSTAITDQDLLLRTEIYSFLAPSEATQFVQPQLQSLILQRLIQETVVEEAAAAAGLAMRPSDFAAAAERNDTTLLTKSYASPAALAAALKANHLDQAAVVRYVETELMLTAMMQRLVKPPAVTAAQVAAYYRAHLSAFEAPQAYDLRVIVVPTAAEAQAILRQVEANHGATFGLLAEEDSIDTGSAPEQGDLGWVTLKELNPGVAAVVEGMRVGSFRLAASPTGYDVLQLLGVRPPGRQRLAAAAVGIRHTLAQTAFQNAAKAYLASLTKHAHIKVLWNPAGVGAGGSGTGTGTPSGGGSPSTSPSGGS